MNSKHILELKELKKETISRMQPLKPIMHEDELEDFEYYERESDGLLYGKPLSAAKGFGSITTNLGAMVNKGFETTLNLDVINRNNFNANIQLAFRQGNWRVESDINKGIKETLVSMGYSPKRLRLY